MAIQASTISSTQTLEEFRQEFNKLQSDVSTLESGPTFTSSIAFEGATADDYETTLTVTDPTADRTITLQNKSGTVALIGTDTLDTVKLNGTDASKTNAGDDVVLDGTDSSSTNAGDALLFEDATGDHLLNQVPFEEYFLLESSFFGSDGTQAKHFLLEQTDGDQIEVEFATSDVTLGAAFRPPAGGGPQFRTPTNDGTANQVFATDGSGNLSFVDRSTGMTLSGSTNNTVVTVTGSNAGQGEGNLTFDGSILAVTGNVTATGTVEPAGDTATGDNAAIGYTAGEGLILTGQGSTSDITVKNDADETVFTVPTGTDDVKFPDNAKVIFGAGDDISIYSGGSAGVILAPTQLRLYTADWGVSNSGASESMINAVENGAVTLYHNNVAKIATTAVGTTITGTLIATTDTDTSNTGSVTLDFGANQNFVLTFTGNVTLANPSTEQVGQSGIICCIQDGTGSRTLSLGTDYETAGGAGITLSTAANAVDIIPYFVKASGSIQLGAVQLAFS